MNARVNGAQVAHVVLAAVDEVGEWDADDLGAEGEVDGSLLGSQVAVERVHVTGNSRGRGEGGKQLGEDAGRERAEGFAAVEDDRLTNACSIGLGVNLGRVSIGLGDRDSIQRDPPPGEAVGGLGTRNNGKLGESIPVLFGVETTVDDGTCRSQS